MKKIQRIKKEEITADRPAVINLETGEQIAVFRSGKRFFAVENRCPHAGAYLNEGIVEGNILTCIWHGWRFELESGQCLNEYRARLKTFSLSEEAHELLIEYQLTGASDG